MRAKVAIVAVVASVLVGGIATPSAYASREKGKGGDGHDKGHDKGHDNGQHHNKYDHSCTVNDNALIGNVCVIVDDLPILGRILTM
jgi:Spy/CpxP family protein refolding chaperone